jgi:mRNA-degrading endonuclease RelE of RelBE toxin-antitoxin system
VKISKALMAVLYAMQKKIRIIYEYQDFEQIIKVIAIDKREELEVYRIAFKRIQDSR